MGWEDVMRVRREDEEGWRGGVDGRVLIVSALNTISSNCTHPH